MACGRAVVSTPAGCRGLDLRDGRDLIVAETDAFAHAIIRLLRNEEPAHEHRPRPAGPRSAASDGIAIAEDALRSYATLLESPKHVERRLKLAAGVVVADRARDFDTPAI